MNKRLLVKLIKEHENTINRMYNTAHNEPSKELQIKSWKSFHKTFDGLAFPGGLERGLRLIKQKDPATIDAAITYLEVDPYFFKSGYIMQNIARLLKKIDLTKEQVARIHDLLINSLNRSRRKEYALLAKKIATQEFCQRLTSLVNNADDPKISRRAQFMLNIIRN